MSEPAPAWFRTAISQGLVRLVALALPGTPPADTIELTREAWIEALWPEIGWAEHLDRERIERGFLSLAASVERWPAPAQLLRAMPARPQQPALPTPPLDAEQRRRARRIIARLRRRLERKRPPSP